MKPTTLIIDADGVLYSSAFIAEKAIEWDDGIISLHADITAAQNIFEEVVARYVDIARATDVILALSCAGRVYFRHIIYPEYKQNRKGGRAPLALKPLRQWVETHYDKKVYERDHLEADDVCGILATHRRIIKGRKIIASIDKDLRQIPGLHLDLNNTTRGVFEVSPEEAERFFWQQVLTGDPVDGYPGCKGIGIIRASRILDEAEGNYAEACRDAYLKAGLSLKEFETQVNVARILTADSYDLKRKEPILWRMT